MKNIAREVRADDMLGKLQSMQVSTTLTNKFIRILERTIKTISVVRATPDQIREENRIRLLTHFKRRI
jgi:hypothetical protein